MWRAKKKHDIAYLLQASSDSASDSSWNYACDYRVLYEFKNPVDIKDLRTDDSFFKGWPAYSGNFQGRSFKIPIIYWNRLNQIALGKEPEYKKALDGLGIYINEMNDPPIQDRYYSLTKLAEHTGMSEALLNNWLEALERKNQAILYGPPGTGKTFLAEHIAHHLVSGGDGFVDLVQFHPAYAYEDFMQGIRPLTDETGILKYDVVPGRFLEFCQHAGERQGVCVLIIDEINRANLARVFGELMYLLEYRDREIPLSVDGKLFKIPENVRIIGTMNTADRSIALVDHALRRRFAFIKLQPNYEVLKRYHIKENTNVPINNLIQVLGDLNRAIKDPNYEIGISYFLKPDLINHLESIWKMEIEPYLEEYFFDNAKSVDQFRWERVKAALGL
jgi:5-methylcytosine-specific restriction protein B